MYIYDVPSGKYKIMLKYGSFTICFSECTKFMFNLLDCVIELSSIVTYEPIFHQKISIFYGT